MPEKAADRASGKIGRLSGCNISRPAERLNPHSFSEAVAVGLAPDGGLFLPEKLPDLSGELARFATLGYADLCFEFMRIFATDIPAETLQPIVAASYARFSHRQIAPLRSLAPRLNVLELFHGPTLAVKDVGLQLLGNLYARQCRVRRQSLNVLGATSGDTGAAAIYGLLGRPGIGMFILYPDGRVSPLQERQMACTGDAHVFALALDGSFDDAQAVLKKILGNEAFRTRHRLSAVNSINLARILAQCVYYLHAWLRLPAAERANVEFVVPTGNFGNILAGWMLRKMGVPIRGFKVGRRTRTTSSTVFSRRATITPIRCGPASRPPWMSRRPQILSASSITAWARIPPACARPWRREPPKSAPRARPRSSPPRAAAMPRFPGSSSAPTATSITSSIPTPRAPSRI